MTFQRKIRFDFLKPLESDDHVEQYALYGRFPPNCRFNIDPVPFSFVIHQDTTFITDNDNDITIIVPSETPQKQ